MAIRFIDRKDELSFLERKYGEKGPQVVVIYGRRRVGKTELIAKFIKNKKAIYFLAEKQEIPLQLERFSKGVSTIFEPGLSFKGWDSAFEYLAAKGKKERIVIVIDEFPYLISAYSAIPSIFQRICDEIIKGSKIFLILCGSSISMMEDKVLSAKSPLYGRRTGEWELQPFSFKNAAKFFEHYKIEDKIIAYSILGGIPAYLIRFSDRKSIKENMSERILSKGEFLYNEPIFLSSEELREPRAYLSMLEAIAKRKRRIVEIANYTKIEARNLPKYLNILERLRYIERRTPMFEEKKRKKQLYFLSDNFFRFWFRFIFPNRSKLEAKRTEEVLDTITANLRQHTAEVFEDIAKETLYILSEKGRIPFSIEEIKPYWGKTKEGTFEIDHIAINKKERKVLFCECKWQSNVDAKKILAELKGKEKLLENFTKNHEIYFSIFAKSFKDKGKVKKVKEKNVFLYDLSDIEKIFS